MNLLIVESPAKARTIEGYLGRDYKVLSSFGHVRDLPPRRLSVDVRHNYKPQYSIIGKARPTLQKIKSYLKKASTLYLATDYDREGEAIAWHLLAALDLQGKGSKMKDKKYLRITFHEITKKAIEKALKKPRDIDMNLVDAQQARRVLDRLVGYKLSPFLWKKVARGLSAGRVQSVAVRLVVEREREIEKFIPKEYWEVIAELTKKGDKNILKAKLCRLRNKKIQKLEIDSSKKAESIKKELEGAKYRISEISDKNRFLSPLPPYRTATLQQDAAKKLRFSAKKTMFVAQKLYEGVDLGKGKRVGLITYMRTDSTNLAKSAVLKARDYIEKKFGKKYLPLKAITYRTKNALAQEAHEAIRPTNPALVPEKVEEYLEKDGSRLYKLIWQRMIASQMERAKIKERIIDIQAGDYHFELKGRKIDFEGFLRVYNLGLTDNELPELKVGEELDLKSLNLDQKFTKAPNRYTEATLVKELEKRGIGRPSTYAPTLSTIQARRYVKREGGYFYPEEIGILVNDVLVSHFPEIVDYNFTAHMEEDLDEIAGGEKEWVKVIDEFYKSFSKHLREKEKTIKKEELAQEKTDKICPECKGEVVIKMGRFGRFYACSNFPECQFKEAIEKKEKEHPHLKKRIKRAEKLLKKFPKCEKCGADMTVRTSRFGTFLGCTAYPKCRHIVSMEEESKTNCPKCGDGKVVKRFTKKGKIFWGCSRYPDCNFASWTKPTSTKERKNGGTKEQKSSGA